MFINESIKTIWFCFKIYSRGGIAERNGSVSDAESEDENDEGDYTVYECPGFATVSFLFEIIVYIFKLIKIIWISLQTGEMEVKNPLFLDEPTPATPAQQPPAASKPKEKWNKIAEK